MLKKNEFFRKKYKLLVLSSFFSYFVFEIGNVADTIIAGLFLSDKAVSAVSIVMPITSFIIFISVLISLGIAEIFVKKLGQFKNKEAYEVAGTGFLSSIIVGVVFAILLFLFKEPLLNAYGVSKEIYEYSSGYYNGMILYALIYPFESFLYDLVFADNDPMLAGIQSFVYVVINSAASLLLVPHFGTFGLSLGTVIALVAVILILFTHLLKKKNSIHIKLCLHLKTLIESMKIGSASALKSLYEALFGIAINKFIIVMFSDAFLPVYAVISSIISLSVVLHSTIDQASSFIALYYTEKNTSELKDILKIIFFKSLKVTAIYTIIVFISVPLWANSYQIVDPVIRNWAILSGRIVSFSFFGHIVIRMMGKYYPIIEEFVLPNIIYLLNSLISPLLCVTILSLIFGFIGVPFGMLIGSYITFIIVVIYLKYFKKDQKGILQFVESNDKNYQFDFVLNKDIIEELMEEVIKIGKENNIDLKKINKIEVILEDTINCIIKKNNGKNILASLNINVTDDKIRVLLQDDGVIFNLLEEAQDARGLEFYVVSSILEKAHKKDYVVAMSYNRNVFVF